MAQGTDGELAEPSGWVVRWGWALRQAQRPTGSATDGLSGRWAQRRMGSATDGLSDGWEADERGCQH